MKIELYIFEEWLRMVDGAKAQLAGTCPLLEDETIIEMNKYICYLEKELIRLKK